MTNITLLLITATAALDLANDSELSFFHFRVDLSYISISADTSVDPNPPNTVNGDIPVTKDEYR